MPTKPGRNDPCPCGSGKKYKRCCIDKDPPTPLRPVRAEWDERSPSAPDDSPPAPAFHENDEAPRPRTEFDDWYDAFDAGPAETKLAMVRTLLSQERPAQFFDQNDFVGILLDLHTTLGIERENEWVSLLQEMREKRRDVFRLGADYFVRDMAYYYIRTQQTAAVRDAIEGLLAEDLPPDDTTYDLLDLLQLAGLQEPARALAMHAVSTMGQIDLLPWATDELTTVAVFFPFQTYLETGCTEAGRAKMLEELASLGCDPKPEYLDPIIAHRTGQSNRRFESGDFLGRKAPCNFNLYLLTLDFARWLQANRSIPAVTAEAMRAALHDCLLYLGDEKRKYPLELPQDATEEYLAGKLGFLSLQRLRGVATLVALRHFTEFLKSVGLIDARRYEQRSSFWQHLWPQVQQSFGDHWCDYAFMEQWW
jgi:hypothetical protein